ncbi:hypothetical protein KIH87_16235 [Paraneptunicella aestuarii]|uniref:hypothetical protein n=1 Tax=Paraneptunicella aestuarii TaxID=2831148 RepID=UPI001E5F2685|nr:hypothetical protein [Paraneptunicella aestuarii]UAA38221.1 hypothetical protein KIH87_16235 [Paraneptunicella aestuarii]
MKIKNLTNPGKAPVDGDRILKTFPNGATEEVSYYLPPEEVVENNIKISTVVWLREHLAGLESKIRLYTKSSEQYSADVSVFMDMISDRSGSALIVSDEDYAAGISTLFKAGLIDTSKATELLTLGKHDPDMYLV